MCKVLMSIKPKYVDEILSGKKKYEYRKIKAKRPNIDKIIIYCTAPVMRVVAEVEVLEIIENNPEIVWKKTKSHAGISKKKYDEYFENKDIAFAYKLGNIIKYDQPRELKEIGVNYTPQSFIYIDEDRS